jgi:hypothetical protein
MLRGALTDPADSRRREAFHDGRVKRHMTHACAENTSIGVPALPLRAASGDDRCLEKIAFGSE